MVTNQNCFPKELNEQIKLLPCSLESFVYYIKMYRLKYTKL
jgi:hypothetical protein